MKIFSFGLFIALAWFGVSQAAPSPGCIHEDGPARLSGKVVYGSWQHPNPEMGIVDGYKIVLLQPRCFAFVSLNDGSDKETLITEVQVMTDRSFLKRNLGKLITVTGTVRSQLTYVIAWPLIDAKTRALCKIAPKAKGVEKC